MKYILEIIILETEEPDDDFLIGQIFVYELSRSEREEELLENDDEVNSYINYII